MSGSEQLSAPLNSRAENEAAARSRIYALLGEAFSYPRGESVLRLLEGDWLADLSQALMHLDHGIDAPQSLDLPDSKNAIETLEQQYSGLFDVLGAAPRVSLLERGYVDTGEHALWQELLGFYRHFGLDFSQGYAEEQPDHLLTELAFMHYLCFLEAGARAGKEDYRRGQRDFLNLHLGKWGDPLCQRLSESAQGSFYDIAADFMRRFIASERRSPETSLEY